MDYGIDELLPIVKKLTEKYTGKESTSVTYEKAMQLMGAVLYCIEEYEGRKVLFSGKEKEVSEVSKLSAGEAYHAGFQLVLEKTIQAKKKYEQILESFHDYGNRCLHDTILEGMPQFFIRYDAVFAPQEHLLTLDYPILERTGTLCGVDLIYRYLRDIDLEQKFLETYSERDVIETLKDRYGNYEDLIINISSEMKCQKWNAYWEL